METKEWRNIDKTGWPAGPWMDEPDSVQWADEATGLPCLIHRGPNGALCGYVGIDESHQLFNTSYGDIDVECHGGLTYSAFCFGEPGEGICHLPGPGEADRVWWLGFDCAHSWDICPGRQSILGSYFTSLFEDPGGEEATYKDIAYVQHVCAALAKQLKELA